MKHPYNIQIEFLDVGAAVNVGCKRLAYQDLRQLEADLGGYIRDPKGFIEIMQTRYSELKEQNGLRGMAPRPEPSNDFADVAHYAATSYGPTPAAH